MKKVEFQVKINPFQSIKVWISRINQLNKVL